MLKARRATENPPRPRKIDPSSANPLHDYVRSFAEYTTIVGLTASTAHTRLRYLTIFVQWAHERGLSHPNEVTRPVLQRYQRHLYLWRKKDGHPLSLASQYGRIGSVIVFFKWLTRQNHILSNPAADLETHRPRNGLPKLLLSVAQVEATLNATPTHTLRGVRDRAMLEVLYSSGIRKGELMRLQLNDLDLERGTLMVRQGKGRKDRLVPLGARACAWVRRYLLEVRAELLAGDASALNTVFLSDWGGMFEEDRLFRVVRGYMLQAGIENGNCHAFRHACATHMLEGGADLRHIQIILGHSQLSTTEIYTHVAIDKLIAVHAATHPARVTREPVREAAPSEQNALQGANKTTDALTPQQAEKAAHRAFLAELAAQDDETADSEQI
jgi:integrase/recombinase XerD